MKAEGAPVRRPWAWAAVALFALVPVGAVGILALSQWFGRAAAGGPPPIPPDGRAQLPPGAPPLPPSSPQLPPGAPPLPTTTSTPSPTALANEVALLARARSAAPDAVAFDEANGARIAPLGDTFGVEWTKGAPWTLVSLHGHSGSAFEDAEHWQPYAASRGFNLIAPQWWVGTQDRMDDYLSPPALYHDIDTALRAVGATPGHVALHGFSRGATQTYALAALDAQGSRWFGTIVANAGGAHTDYPPTGEIERGRYGPTPFSGQRWILFCGGKDPDPQINGCPAMRETKRWLTDRGGTVVSLIEDPKADHGGFQRNPANVKRALDLWLGGR
jgi:hypothetical protein